MEIRKVVLLGAGAVGAYFIRGLSGLSGISFCLAASGSRLEGLQKEGIEIDDGTGPALYRPEVLTPKEAAGADLLLVATKYDALASCLEDIKAIAGENTVVMSLLNGIDSEEIIAGAIGEDRLLWSVMRITSARNGQSIRFDAVKTPGVNFGEKDGSDTPRVRAVEELFTRAGIRCRVHPDIISDQWCKYALNIAYNLPQAVFGTGFASYFDSAHMGYIRDRLEAEVRAVAAAEGITFPALENKKESWPATTRFSTLQDLDAGRHTEADMFLKVLSEKASRHGISVPFAEYTWHALKILEEKNDGLFSY